MAALIGQSPGFARGGRRGLSGGGNNGSDFMSAAEQLEDLTRRTPPRRDVLLEEEAFIESPADAVAGQDRRQAASAAGAGALRRALPRTCAARLRLADGRGDHHAGRAGRGAAHDRFRLQPRRHRADQQLFQRHDRGRRRARRRQRVALLPRHDDRRAHRRRSAARRVRASDLAVAGLLRFRALAANWCRG